MAPASDRKIITTLIDSEPDTESAPESPEKKRARLLAELAELPPDPADEARIAAEKQRLHDLAVEEGRKMADVQYADPTASDGKERILFHFLEDGFTALGQIWMRGQELEFVVDSEEHNATKDRSGMSWVDLVGDEFAQAQKYGKVMFRKGPWPGHVWEGEAADIERKRKRMPPKTQGLPRR